MSSKKERRLSYLVGLSLMGTVAFTGLTATNAFASASAVTNTVDNASHHIDLTKPSTPTTTKPSTPTTTKPSTPTTTKPSTPTTQLAAPVIASAKAMNVVNNITMTDIANRSAMLRTQAAAVGNVQGASDNGEGNVWVSIKHNKVSVSNNGYKDSDIKTNNYMIGYDTKTSANSYFGGYISMTNGSIKTDDIDTNIDSSMGFGLYGTTLLGKGQYVNYIGRMGSLKNSYLGQDWKTKDYGVTVEYGKKTQQAKDLFVTPYVQLNYDHLDTDSVQWAGNRVNGGTSNNMGMKLGVNFMKNDDRGNSYYGGLALGKDFSGKYKATVNGIAMPEVDNNGNTVYVNFGTRQKMNDNGYFDLNLEKTFASMNGWGVQGRFNWMF